MSRKTSKTSDSPFTRLLGWTVVLALVFSAGMITGQRLIRQDSVPPLVSLSVSKEAQASVQEGKAQKRIPLETTFSFYDHLSKAPSRDELVPAEDAITAEGDAEPTSAEKPTTEPQPAAEPPAEEGVEDTAPAEAEKPAPAETPEPDDSAGAVVAAKEVEVEAQPEPAPEPEKPAADALIDRVTQALGAPAETRDAPEVAGQYTIQVGNHASKASAVRELARLRAMSLDAHMTAVEVSGKRFYRVRVGKFENDTDARATLQTLASKEITGMVVPL